MTMNLPLLLIPSLGIAIDPFLGGMGSECLIYTLYMYIIIMYIYVDMAGGEVGDKFGSGAPGGQ